MFTKLKIYLTCSLAASPLLSVPSVGGVAKAEAAVDEEAFVAFFTTCTSLFPREPTVVEGFTGGWEESGGREMMNCETSSCFF